MIPTTWLDEVIDPKAIEKGDAIAIAQSIAASPQFLDAIKHGLAKKPEPGVIGPSHAQIIAEEIRTIFAGNDWLSSS